MIGKWPENQILGKWPENQICEIRVAAKTDNAGGESQ